jgi:TnpA family transposase
MNNLLSEEEKMEITQISENISKEEIIKYYTCSEFNLNIINKYRKDHNKLGFAIQLGVLKHKGWQMSYMNNIPDTIILYVSKQLNVGSNVFQFYYNRQNTIFEHFKDIKDIYGYKSFSESDKIVIIELINALYKESDNSYFLISNCIEKLKSMKIVLPGISKIEEIICEIKLDNEEKIINIINSNITNF